MTTQLKEAARFPNTGEDFSGYHAAENWCRENGYSLGSMQRESPIGLMVGDYDIAKWRNLDDTERAELHGVIEFENGGPRVGTSVIKLRELTSA